MPKAAAEPSWSRLCRCRSGAPDHAAVRAVIPMSMGLPSGIVVGMQGGADDSDTPFLATVHDPSGVTFDVQAVPMYVGNGPTTLGNEDGSTQGFLGFLNRTLARGPISSGRRFGVFVYRDEPGGPIVAESVHPSKREATHVATSIARAIENGTFRKDGS